MVSSAMGNCLRLMSRISPRLDGEPKAQLLRPRERKAKLSGVGIQVGLDLSLRNDDPLTPADSLQEAVLEKGEDRRPAEAHYLGGLLDAVGHGLQVTRPRLGGRGRWGG